MYHIYYIRKKSGKYRKICAPCPELKEKQRELLRQLEPRLRQHPCATGFRTGKSIVDNARIHQGPWLFNIDLKDFFDSIHRNQLYPKLIQTGLQPEEANEVCDLTTLPKEGHLPQGAVTSPFLSNVYCYAMDKKLYTLCKSHQLKYSRYADDITISGSKENILAVRDRVFAIIAGNKLQVNWKKVHLQGPGHRQEVTGLLVNSKISCGRKEYQKIRTAVHRGTRALEAGCSKEDIANAVGMPMETLFGRISFMTYVNPDYNNLKTSAKSLYIAFSNMI